MSTATTLNLTPTAAAPTATPAPASGKQCVVFANDGGAPTVNVSATDPVMVGDTGSGGLAGNVPAPGAGDAAAGKFLKADGTFAVPAGSGGSPAFSAITSGSNTAATMTVGTGASLEPTGSGVIEANEISGVTVSATPPTTGQVLTATSSSAADWQTPGSGSYQPSALPLPPASSAFTLVNNETMTLSTVGSVLVLQIGFFSSSVWQFASESNAYSTPYSIAMAFSVANVVLQANSSYAGLYLYDGTKLLGIEICMYADAQGGTQMRVERMNSVSSDDATVYGPVSFESSSQNNTSPPTQGVCYLRWRNDGTTLYADCSPDGIVWNNFYSEAVGAWLTPTQYGWGGLVATTGDQVMRIKLGGWLATNSATE